MAHNKIDPTSNYTAAFSTSATAFNTITDIVNIYIPLIGAVKLLVGEIYQIYENAECNKEICLIMTNRVKAAECSMDMIVRNMNDEEGEFRRKSYYVAFKRFENILINIKDFSKDVSKLKGYKRFMNAKDVKLKYEKLTDEFEDCMKDLHFAIDTYNAINREKDAQKVDKALDEVNQLLSTLGDNVQAIAQDVSFIKAQITNQASQVHATKINEKDLDNPPVSKADKVRGNVVRKIYRPLGVEVACKPESKYQETELAILGLLGQSPHILRFYGLTTLDNRQTMVTAWAEYGNLRELYNKYDIPWTRKIQVIRDICRGISFLRTVNIFHHDLRCENVFVLHNLNIKIGNFKCARKADADHSTNLKDLYTNIISWMAPELMEKYKDLIKRGNEKVYTFNCEMFSFGMLMWELCYEKMPYEGWKMPQIIEHVLSGKREDVSEGKFQCPNDKKIQLEFISIISKAWIHSANLRISITELNNKIEELADKYPIPLNSPLLLDDKELDFDGKKNQASAESLFPEFDDPDIIDEDDIIVPIEDGIKMHRNGDHQGAWKSFEQNSVLPLAKFWQGYYYSNGYVVPKDVDKARQLFKEAADDNHPESQYRYAVMLLSKKEDNEDSKVKTRKEILYYLKLAAENKNSDAMYYLGDIFMNGKLKVNKDEGLGLKYLKLAANSKNGRAIDLLKKLNKY